MILSKIRSASLAMLTGIAPLALTLLPAAPAFAHHGWSSFDTRHAYYASGTVTYVRWGNPHSEVRLRIDKTALPADWEKRPLPSDAERWNGQATMKSARPYGGERKELRLVLAGPEWMERWGMDRALKVGEKIEVVGYLNNAEGQELRPVIFWLADGKPIWQQLTPFPHQPEPAPK
jgi:hypothetical protein